ncbi:serine protease [Conexibacter stalactiti]|uniref:Serine protease n=1 Tax=Conexibacter stalactiti TaxID=1940611 RepID=A0ABU4HS48_9ACTN|nr:serine protease [Conexibacter stalactiti]MDW5595507.1 serine protease [Conexibacter stalactiti]MEC5036149.1 serine protease [Conexibacter stalactiti]
MTPRARFPLLALLLTLVIGSAAQARTPIAAPSARARASVVGGTPAAAGILSSVVFITSQTSATSAMACSGTVLAPTVVLTAAHCVVDETTTTVRPAAGIAISSGRLDRTEAGQDVGAARVLVHPAYDPRAIRSDAALLVLSAPLSAAPVAVAGAGDAALAAPGAPALFAGWGATSGNSSEASSRLLQTTTTVLADDLCRRLLGADFDAGVTLCAVDSPRFAGSTCRGDSGGPLLLQRGDGALVQAGITSWGSLGCDTRVPQAFTRVSAISGWIAEQLAAVAATPSTTAPADDGSLAGTRDSGAQSATTIAAALYRGSTRQRRAIAVRVASGGRTVAGVQFAYRARCELPARGRGRSGGGSTVRRASTRSGWRNGAFRSATSTRLPIAARASGGAFTTQRLDSSGRRVRVTGAFSTDGRLRGTLRVSWRERGGARCDSGVVRYSAQR